MMKGKGISLDYPLRADFLAQVVIPINLTEHEAQRLCAFIKTIPIPDDAAEEVARCD